MRKTLCLALISVIMAGCSSRPTNVEPSGRMPDIYPDYIGVSIPVGIAPLNFDIRGGCERIDLAIKGEKSGELHLNGKTIDINIKDWHKITEQNKGAALTLTLCVKKDGRWRQYKDFKIHVSNEPLDDWGLTYRLIAPGYVNYEKMGIYQRNLSNFDETPIFENTSAPGACVNCHTENKGKPNQMTFHVRGAYGATLVQIDGKREWLDTKTDSTLGSCVYPYWHPEGRYIAFSTNKTAQNFHANKAKLIEVYDEGSDLQVYDTRNHQLIISPLVKTKEWMETYPVFSPDGKYIYFCTATQEPVPAGLKNIRYNICRIGFDARKGEFGNNIDTIFDARSKGVGAVHPRPSYDGRFLMFTVCDYGCFPIWHKESDQWIIDLRNGEARPMTEANSNNTDSYHNWSTNSHWFVFTSRRDDGLYSRLYLASIDSNGKITKPFMLPQRHPYTYYLDLMKSYNTPDFTTVPVTFDHKAAGTEIMSCQRIRLSVKKGK